ncbi:hypothetical protein Cfor_10151 [Coptotermes formosanus]|uniref:PIH1D1/2/3 CS-like domain-containing protein n=1 Tax=Coptotermes formosanus TaxID=36987 RepID=A0A6L2PCC1_COPFO|nr:hypothetical protein Cfor_10151 [Coptotermes formosanus]
MYRRNIGIAIATLPEQPASLAVWFIAKNIEGYSFHPSIGVVQKKMELNYQDIRRLAEILRPTEEDSDSEDDLPQTGLSALGPGNIGPKKGNGDGNCAVEVSGESTGDANIWDEREIPDVDVDMTADPRDRPEFDIKYRQAVTPEDVYLQMGGKTTGTASCEDMVVSVHLPGETRNQVDLEVTRQRLDVRSPRYRLSLPMPHPVDPDSSRAEWLDSLLIVTLRMQREFDFINF